MSVLSDRDLKAEIEGGNQLVWPMDLSPVGKQLQPASIDVRMGDYIRSFCKGNVPFIDVRKPMLDLTIVEPLEDDIPYWLHPGQFVLGVTFEVVTVPNHLVAELKGKSSLGRIGLMIHATAGYIDPGWKGPVTMELSNVGEVSISLYKDMWIGQMVFEELTSSAERPYGSDGLGSRYTDAADDKEPQASRAYLG